MEGVRCSVLPSAPHGVSSSGNFRGGGFLMAVTNLVLLSKSWKSSRFYTLDKMLTDPLTLWLPQLLARQ
jgi:hypothetical protein